MIPLVRQAFAQNPSVPSTPGQEDGLLNPSQGIVPECATQAGGAQDLNCFLELFINTADILLGLVGAIMLAVLVYGGFLYLTSQGDSSKVGKATKMLTGSLVGLLIVFGAYTGVTWGVQILRGDVSGTDSTYYLCGTEANPENDGEACAAGFVCANGACIDPINPPE